MHTLCNKSLIMHLLCTKMLSCLSLTIWKTHAKFGIERVYGFGERRVTDRRQTESEKYYIEDTYHFRFHFLPLLLKTRQCFLRHKYAQGWYFMAQFIIFWKSVEYPYFWPSPKCQLQLTSGRKTWIWRRHFVHS